MNVKEFTESETANEKSLSVSHAECTLNYVNISVGIY